MSGFIYDIQQICIYPASFYYLILDLAEILKAPDIATGYFTVSITALE